MTPIRFIISLAILAYIAVGEWWDSRTPEGYEDETGFHFLP